MVKSLTKGNKKKKKGTVLYLHLANKEPFPIFPTIINLSLNRSGLIGLNCYQIIV